MFSCEYCEIFKISFFYRATLVAASGIETFFQFVIYNFKIYENTMTQNSMTQLDSGHFGKYSYEIPHEYL